MASAFQSGAFQQTPTLAFQIDGGVTPVTTTVVDVAGAKRRRRYRDGDEELTEAELQFMFRKIAELKKAKADTEKERIAKELEVALAHAANDEEAAEVISETIEKQRPEIPKVGDYSAVFGDIGLLTNIVNQLRVVVLEAKRIQDEEDDIEILMLSI